MKDHTLTIIAGAVVIFVAITAATVALEVVDSENTMALVAILGTGMASVAIPSLLNLLKSEETARGVSELKGQLNGDLDARIEAAAARAVRTVMQQRDAELDDRIRGIAHEVVSTEIDRLVLACDLQRRDEDA